MPNDDDFQRQAVPKDKLSYYSMLSSGSVWIWYGCFTRRLWRSVHVRQLCRVHSSLRVTATTCGASKNCAPRFPKTALSAH